MRTAAVGGAILVTGLMAGGTAFADSGASSEPVEHTNETTSEQSNETTQDDSAESSGVQATSNEDRSGLVGVQAPIALDLHEGVANDLNAHEAVHDVVRVGDVVPAPDANADVANTSAAAETTSQNAPAGGADESDHNGTDAPAHQVADVADPVAGVVAQVDRVHNLVQVGG